MNIRWFGLTIVLASSQILQAQSGCPSINFLTPSTASIVHSGTTFRYIFVKQLDGSYTEQDYQGDPSIKTNHKIDKVGSAPKVDQAMFDCLGLSGRSRHPVAPNLKVDPLGQRSSAIVVADLAGDGIGSMLSFWTQAFGEQLVVVKGGSDYSVASTAGYAVGAQPISIIVGDYNGDGKKDVAVVYFGPPSGNTGGGVSLLLGNGDGTLKPAVNIPTTGQWTQIGTAYDFNGDGLTDLVLGSYQGAVTILLGSRTAGLTVGATYSLGTNSLSTISVADITGDGKADVLAFRQGVGFGVLNGQGDGTFTVGSPIAFARSYGSSGIGDFNKDGIPDLAVGVFGEGASILLGTGAGKFATPVTYGIGTGSGFFVEDFDGDGNLDLVYSAGHPDVLTPFTDSAVRVMFGNGDGTFVAPLVTSLDGDTNDQTYLPTTVVAVDLNGDGKPDIATANGSGKSVSVMLRSGNGFLAPKSYTLTVQPAGIVAGDFSGDGKADLIVTDGKTNIYAFTNNGDGTLQLPISFPVGGTTAKAIAAGDFNGDKKLDLVVANAGSNNVSVLIGFGDNSYRSPVTYATGPNPVGVVVGDFNGDGKLDLAVANGSTFSSSGGAPGTISVLIGNGDGTFKAAVSYPSWVTTESYPTAIVSGDVNGDKVSDLVLVAKQSTGSYSILTLLGKADGTFQAPFLADFTSFGAANLLLSDLNGDGKLDLVAPHCCGTANLTVFNGVGNGAFDSEMEVSGGSFFAAAVADFNGDSKPDLAATSFSLGGPHVVSILQNASPAAVNPIVITSAAGNPLKLPPVTPYEIVTAKGAGLATGTLVNSAATPPTNMLGTTITVKDSAGVSRPAQLFYVSGVQVNFLIPQATAVGTATVTITSGDGTVSAGTVEIAPVAPSVFAINSNSLVAAYVQRVHGDLSQSIEYLYAVDASNNVTFPAIDMGPSTDQVYLNIYGTGIAGSPQSAVSVKIGNANAQVFYSGPSSFPGEDQIAVLVPRSLIGAGTVSVVVTASGLASNTTTLGIK